MAENPSPSMHESLEKDIHVLEERLQSLKTEQQKVSPREAVREHLAGRIYGTATIKPAAPPATTPSVTPLPAASADDSALPVYMKQRSDEDKFVAKKLIDIAWHKGIDVAVREAKTEGVFMLDVLHDALTDKLYEEFKRRGLI
jgi:hypothetical protein